MDGVRTITLAVLILLFAYPFTIYPVIIAAWARRKGRGVEVAAAADFPRIALVICALNEQGIIREKVENSLALQYPQGKLTIIVISDGSTDRTPDIVREYRDAGVVLLDRKVRRGKIANLNEVIPSRSEEIIVLSDANVLYDPHAVMRLAAGFSDRSVGCVSGKVVLADTTPVDLDRLTGQYYSVEWQLQENSSTVYSMVGADGAMYALRRELFSPCPTDTLIEDLVIPMGVVAQGRRVVFEPKALGWERGVESLAEEFRRRVRIAAGAAQGLLRGNAWPRNAPARFWLIFVSHKLMRWLSPITGTLVMLAALVWSSEPVAQATLAAVAAITALALLKLMTGWKHPLLSAPFYFLFGEIAMLIGLLKGLAGNQTVLWAKADR
ncbi:MAG: glycosyltransferase family 2 protein [Candidatus Solibacter sp.]|nr:glycosyltransferase family 2 protein [Candidatus Solibacter sp.]